MIGWNRLHNLSTRYFIHYVSRANGSILGICQPAPKFPVARLGWRYFTDLMIQSARFLSFREHTCTLGATKRKHSNELDLELAFEKYQPHHAD